MVQTNNKFGQVLERKQVEEEEAKRSKEGLDTKIEHTSKCQRNTITTIATALSLAKKAEIRACSDEKNREDEYHNGKFTVAVDITYMSWRQIGKRIVMTVENLDISQNIIEIRGLQYKYKGGE